MGCFLKTPRFPIWVVCSESHFSVLFSLHPELLRNWRAERLFDLYYYDGLANQQEQIRLTVGALPPAGLHPRALHVPGAENHADPGLDWGIRDRVLAGPPTGGARAGP